MVNGPIYLETKCKPYQQKRSRVLRDGAVEDSSVVPAPAPARYPSLKLWLASFSFSFQHFLQTLKALLVIPTVEAMDNYL
jgi:hypothetical protein